MANLKLNIAAITGAVAETNCLNEQSQAADLDGIKAKFRERLIACMKAREEVKSTIQEQLPFILANAKVEEKRWGGGCTEYFVGEDAKVYIEANDGYENDRYDLVIKCDPDGRVANVVVERMSVLNAKRLGVRSGYIGCEYGFMFYENEEAIDRAIGNLTRDKVEEMGRGVDLAEEYYEKVYLPMVGVLFAHIRDRAARLAAQLRKAEDKVCPKVTHRVIIEIAKVG